MIIKKFNIKDFDNIISKGIVVIDFYADWCGPCKMLMPVLEELSKKNDITILEVNVDKYNSLARKYGVMTIPTLVLYKNGIETRKEIGFKNLNEIEEWIK